MSAFPLKLFISYAHKDEDLRVELNEHLSNLQAQGTIAGWHDRQILPGQEWANEIDKELNTAQIVLLLISASFIASKYCREIEMKRAMERHEAGEAVVIPVIVRACDWEGAPFSKLQGVPKNAKPVKSWDDRDEAWADVVREIRRAVERLRKPAPPPGNTPESSVRQPDAAPPETRGEAPPDNALYLRCNREKLREEFLETLQTHRQERPYRPLFCLIHGRRFDCHDDFLARLKSEILPSRYDAKLYDFHWKQPPAPQSTTKKFWLRFDEDWLKTKANSLEESRARIQTELAKLNGPLLVRLQWHSPEFGSAQTNGLLNFLNFWQDWPDLPEQSPVICALALVYAETRAAPDTPLTRWAFWRKAAPDPVGEWVAQLAAPQQQIFPAPNFSFKVLERLKMVEYHEVARWCSDDEVRRVRDLTDEVIEIFKCSDNQPIEMHALTKVLKKLLAGEPLSAELLAHVQKRS